MDYEQHYLQPLLAPDSIAIIGASEREASAGAVLVRNMLEAGYRGRLFFINPKYKRIFGQPCHAHIKAVPQRVDLAVICTPAKTLPSLITACGKAGTRTVLIISSLAAAGGQATDTRLEDKLVVIARRYRLRLLGPNALGIMRPSHGINLTYTLCKADPGSIGLISQSGALCTAMLDWAASNNVGFSSVVSLGTSSDVDFGEVLDYMVSDPRTRSIFLHIEGIRNARRFMSALRAAARCKPVLVLKVGRHPAGVQAVRSHSGAVVGNDAVFDAALQRAGVIRLLNVGQLYATVQALFAHFQPRGKRLAILTNGGGLGAMAADHADHIGVELAELSPATLRQLNKVLPAGWSRSNPLDLGGEAEPEHYACALQSLQQDAHVDGVLALLAPQVKSDPTQSARQLIKLARQSEQPLLTCWMGDAQVAEARRLFQGASIPCFRTPEPAVELFSHLSNYYRNQKLLLQVPAAASWEKRQAIATDSTDSPRLVPQPATAPAPTLPAPHLPAHIDAARALLKRAMRARRQQLTGAETQSLLAAFHVPLLATQRTKTQHRPDAEQGLRISLMQDAIFGPAIRVGPASDMPAATGPLAAGTHCIALPPLDTVLIADMLQTPVLTRYLGGRPAVAGALETLLLRVAEMACELPCLHSLELNLMHMDETGLVVTAARASVHERKSAGPAAGNYDHMAIHPYPVALISQFTAHNGQQVTLRPIKPEDARLAQDFVHGLSPQTRYFRFMNAIRELSAAQLVRLTQIDYDREMAFIAVVQGKEEKAEKTAQGRKSNPAAATSQVGVARYAINPDGVSCEFAIVVADDWQGQGLARQLMHSLIDTARKQADLHSMSGDILADNQRMLNFVSQLGFVITAHPDEPNLKRAVLKLKPEAN